jgi:hypothetical protein
MKRILITTVGILIAGLCFSAEPIHTVRKNILEYDPALITEAQALEKGGVKAMGEKIVTGIDTNPHVTDSFPAVTVKQPVVVEKAPPAILEKAPIAVEVLVPKKANFYVRMNVMEQNLDYRKGYRDSPIPGFGLGYRREVGNAAVDFSAGYSAGRRHGGSSELINMAKVAYFYYLAPTRAQSFYVGPGVAYGRVKTNEGARFEGLIPSASIGYEMSRRGSILSFFQLDVSLPAVPSKIKGALPGAIAELAFGAGF